MDVESKIVVGALRLGGFLMREGDRLLEPLGLGQQEFVVLNSVAVRGPVNHKEVGKVLLLEKSNLSKIVSRLEVKGLIRVSPDDTDRRKRLLRTTDAGKRVLVRGTEIFVAWNRQWLESLESDEKEIIAGSMGRLVGLCHGEAPSPGRG